MVQWTATAIAFAGALFGANAAWTPADGLKELDMVEQALHQVKTVTLDSAQKKFAERTVGNVEHILAELKSGKNMTKAQKESEVHAAITALQGLQSQWELSMVEAALNKALKDPHLTPKQLMAARKVVTDVNAVVDEIESGKLTGAEQKAKVGLAIKELTGLEQEWSNATVGGQRAALEKEIAMKQALLAKYQQELKLADLQKELLQKQLELRHLVEEKNQAEAVAHSRQEDAAQQDMVAKLIATAKALTEAKRLAKAPAAVPANATNAAKGKHAASLARVQASNSTASIEPKNIASPAKQGAIASILADLKARAQKVSDTIGQMDAQEKKREVELTHTIEAKVPTAGKKDAINRGQAVLKMLAKREARSYKKARAVRESELQELNMGIHSIEQGDVAALSKLMGKMQAESKALQSKAKNFLY